MNDDYFVALKDAQIGESLQQNLNHLPADTFTYDEVLGSSLERLFDNITFYNEVDIGITLDAFLTTQQLRHFVPVATYDEGSKFDSRLTEIVSMVEGTYYPFFGFSSGFVVVAASLTFSSVPSRIIAPVFSICIVLLTQPVVSLTPPIVDA